MKYQVNLTKRVLLNGVSRFLPVVMAANGRVKPNAVVIDGREAERKDGTYYLDWHESGKRIRQAVGPDGQKANLERQRQETILNGKAVGMIPTDADGRLLVLAIDEFLSDIRISRAKRTWQKYRTALDYFKRFC